MTTEFPDRTLELNEVDSLMTSISKSEGQDDPNKKIAIKNITDKIHVKRGSIRSFTINSTPYFVEPGSAVSIPNSFYKKIKDNRDSYGQLIWELCSASDVDANNTFRRKAMNTEDAVQNVGLDNDFIETFMSLIAEKDSKETALNLITTCESKATLDHIMKEVVGKSGLEIPIRNEIVNKVILQLNDVRRKTT